MQPPETFIMVNGIQLDTFENKWILLDIESQAGAVIRLVITNPLSALGLVGAIAKQAQECLVKSQDYNALKDQHDAAMATLSAVQLVVGPSQTNDAPGGRPGFDH